MDLKKPENDFFYACVYQTLTRASAVFGTLFPEFNMEYLKAAFNLDLFFF
jgi:hypothetical protein